MEKTGAAPGAAGKHISNVNASQYHGLFDAAFRATLRAGTEAEKKKD